MSGGSLARAQLHTDNDLVYSLEGTEVVDRKIKENKVMRRCLMCQRTDEGDGALFHMDAKQCTECWEVYSTARKDRMKKYSDKLFRHKYEAKQKIIRRWPVRKETV